MNPKTALSIAILGAGATLVFLAVRKGQRLVDAVNPFNNDNVIASGFDELITLGQADDGFSLGGFIFDLFHPEFDPNAPVERTAGERDPVLETRTENPK